MDPAVSSAQRISLCIMGEVNLASVQKILAFCVGRIDPHLIIKKGF
jgi:hypothetical protein